MILFTDQGVFFFIFRVWKVEVYFGSESFLKKISGVKDFCSKSFLRKISGVKDF